eukprot:1824325-Prymnesium_polylepis.2
MARGEVHPRVITLYIALLRNACEAASLAAGDERASSGGGSARGRVQVRSSKASNSGRYKKNDSAEAEESAEELRRLNALPPEELNVQELSKAISSGAKAGVEKELLESSKEALKAAELRASLTDRLARLSAVPELNLDLDDALKVWGEAVLAGVARDPIEKLQ